MEIGTLAGKASRPDKSQRPHRTLLGLRCSALIEAVLFLGIAMAVDHFFLEGGRFREMAIHPFWLIVVLISAQYGTAEGFVAAGLSTTCLLIGNMPEQSLSQDAYQYLFSICRLPVSWFVIALVLGEIRMRHIRERDELRDNLAETEGREQNLAKAYQNLSAIKDKLEARVAGQLTTAITMYQAARDLEKLEPADVLRGMVDVVRAVMKPEKFSIYLLKDNLLEVAVHEGWRQNDHFSRTYTSAAPLFRAAIGGQRFLCCVSREDEVILAQEGILAGPLMTADTGEIFGLLKIEKLSFLNLNFSNVQTFKVLCQWIASAYANAQQYEIARSDSVLNIKTRLLSYGFFKQHTAHLAELAKRLGFDLSMLVVRLDNETELTADKRSLIPGIMSEAVKTVLRKTDLVFEHQRSGYEYAIVLPNTPVKNAQIVADKLLGYLSILTKDKVSNARFCFSVHSLHREEIGTKIYRGEIVPKQIEFFTHLAQRVGFDLSMIEIRLAGSDEFNPEMRGSIHGVMCQLLEDSYPPGEFLVSSRSSSCIYQILLFGESLDAARANSDALAATVADRFAEKKIPARMTFAVHAIHQQNLWEYQYARR
jgi:hypothetical protein